MSSGKSSRKNIADPPRKDSDLLNDVTSLYPCSERFDASSLVSQCSLAHKMSTSSACNTVSTSAHLFPMPLKF
ncbi:hypothetical protein J6590_011070 [Homalodisca vitripennis]|nr:hypothetical protein J6590_011070 [Homalodisca vitripennis]